MEAILSHDKTISLQDEFFGNEIRERAVLDAVAALLPGHTRFLDVGANVGQFTHWAAQVLRDAEIICVEPTAALLPQIQRAIDRVDQARGNRFRIVNAAASDVPGRLTFYVEPALTTSSVFRRDIFNPVAVEVDAIQLDAFHQPGSRTFVKLDVEGAEYRALLGAPKLLAAWTVTWLIEVHPFGDAERRKYPLQLCAFMATRGYGMRKADGRYWMGSHFLFTRAPILRRWADLACYFPPLVAVWVVYRFFSGKTAWRLLNLARRLSRR